MGWFGEVVDSVGNFISDNKGWLKPVASAITSGLKQTNVDNSQSQYLDYLRERERRNYEDSVAQINAYNASLGSMGGGGSGGGNGAAVAAARATEANRMAALKKGNKQSQKTYKQLLEIYSPFKDTVNTLMPQMSQTYQNSLGLQNALSQFVNSPAQVAKLNAGGPAWNVNVPLPESMRLK